MAQHDPHSYADLTQGKTTHIDLRIKADFDAQLLIIEADYQLAEPISGSFFLDTSKIDLEEAHSNGRPLQWEFDQQDELLGERLHLKGLENASSFTLAFATLPEARALQWLPAVQTAGGQHPFLYSQCQAIHARSIFPCQDTPSVRFTFSAEVEVPKALTVVMAAEQVGVEERGANKVFRFKMPQPIPSYLFAIGVGNLAFHELGPRTGVYAEPEIVEAAAWEFAENEAKIVEAEKLLGPYLWGRYDLLILPPSFPYGGMENPRLTFLTPTAILGTRGQTFLITHELAHAWTGNLVTNATWEDFWLNEGWTTYAETRITEVLEGKEIADLMAVYDEQRLLEVMERVGMGSSLTCLKVPSEGRDPDATTTIIPYYKGSFLLKECEYAVGRERFDAFIQKYTGKYQFQSLTTEAFLDYFKQELSEVFEKVDVYEWIYEPGLTENRSRPQSTLYDEVQEILTTYNRGTRPTKEQVADWHRYQIFSFLQALPTQIPVKDCKYFEDILELENKNDAGNYMYFYATCIASGYQEILPRIEQFIGKVGRLLYIMPIFRAMIAAAWAKPHARRILEQVQERHHKITVHVINKLLEDAGL
ncbi:MAG: leukotriene A4 hydrolase C-terminal domain-containing protein [Anaerolineales bacterium]|nr:leukotriene A4 hydrolase C-terminal domain-containing protein [Anaerolineales bacterium]